MNIKFTRLTRDACRKARSGETITEHGISFERMANGNGRWKINVMVDGQRIHRVIGMESDGVTREQAENAIEKLRTEAREGRLNLPKGRKIALGFQEAAAKYLEKSTAITHLVQAVVDLPTVQRISGHKTLQMVVRYSHQNGEHIRAAMDKLEDRYHPTETKASTVTPIVKLSAVNSRE